MTATLASTPRLGRATNALVGKAKRRHVLGAIDVAQIDDHGSRHLAFQPLKIERAELHPFRHDHQCVGTARAYVGIVAIFDIGQFAARLLHADRMPRATSCTSAPTFSARSAISLMKVILVARNALAAYLINSAVRRAVNISGG